MIHDQSLVPPLLWPFTEIGVDKSCVYCRRKWHGSMVDVDCRRSRVRVSVRAMIRVQVRVSVRVFRD